MSNNEYGKIFKRVWGDPDFKQLAISEQHLYFKLISQPDVSLAGVLTYAPARWAGQTSDLTVADIEHAFDGLARRRYVLVDGDTQEVLIRSYVRNDMGWKSPRTMIGISNAVGRILSADLARAASREIARLDTGGLSGKVNSDTGNSTRSVVEGVIAEIVAQYPPMPDTPCDGVSDTPCDTPSDGVSAVRTHNSNSKSSSSSSSKSNISCASDADASAPRDGGADASTPKVDPLRGFDEWWDVYAHKVDRHRAEQKWKVAIRKKGVTPEMLIESARSYIATQRAKGKHPEFTKNPSTWLNSESWTNTYDQPADDPDDGWGPPPIMPRDLYGGTDEDYRIYVESMRR